MALDNLEVGDVLINVESKINSIDKRLDEAIKQLKSFKSVVHSISKLNLDNFRNNLEAISKVDLTGLGKAFEPINNIDTKKISSFNRQMKNIANLNFDNVDFRKLYTQINTLTRIIDPFIQKIQKAEPSLKAFSNAIDLGRVNSQLMVAEAKVSAINQKAKSKKVLDDIKIQKANLGLEKTKKRIDEINNKSNKTNKTFNSIFNIGKLYFWLNYTKRITNTIGSWFNSAISFDETLNKFQVSFGEYTQEARKFANELTQAFNLSTESVLNYMATFNNMLTSLGSLSRDTATQLSETLTRMAIDYASLFNVSIETAMNQFQSVLSGSIK